LKSNNVRGASGLYWNEAPTPCMVDVYHGFNIVAYHGYYFGLRQTVGPIDLSGSLIDLVQQFQPGDVLVARSVVELQADIDGVSTSMRVRQESAAANERAHRAIRMLEVKNAELEQRIVEQEKQLSSLLMGKLGRSFWGLFARRVGKVK